ncbi:MAG: hypothetical protein L0L46_08785, partial [Tetragenococcus halophilus]|nr:hypothetical protein [Tetragenococcus halophilus]
MSFSKIALASLKYHRRMTAFYVIFLVISFFLLFIIFLLTSCPMFKSVYFLKDPWYLPTGVLKASIIT